LFFASARADSRLIDIYVSERQPDGTWGTAKNIGEPINTEGNDKSPFIHSDSHTLYFSSDGHLGFGKMDVFYSRMQDDGTWGEPQNIGTPINSEEDEHGFVVSTDGKLVYFGSDKLKSQGKGGFDIFSFYLYKEARPEKVVFLKGTLKDENNEVIKDATIEIKNPKTNEVTEFKVDSTDGSYAAVVTLKKNDKVIMNVKSEKKDIFYSKLFTEKDTADTFVNLDMNVQTLEKGKTIQINDIHYATNSAEIVEESKLILDELVALMKKHPSMKIAIYGHTDNQGDMELNMALSTDRAFSVMEYLQQQGIEKNRLTFKGFGPTKPIATNDTEEGRALNRRTEFEIIDM
jgi:outer membrane protein OmpA-like peptidoglycan-associated protein